MQLVSYKINELFPEAAVQSHYVKRVAFFVCRVRAAEGSALRALKEKVFAHRSELIAGFQQYDQNNTGKL